MGRDVRQRLVGCKKYTDEEGREGGKGGREGGRERGRERDTGMGGDNTDMWSVGVGPYSIVISYELTICFCWRGCQREAISKQRDDSLASVTQISLDH